MATLPHSDVEHAERKLTLDEAAAELYKLVESHYDDLGLSDEERDLRYASAREFLNTRNAASAKA